MKTNNFYQKEINAPFAKWKMQKREQIDLMCVQKNSVVLDNNFESLVGKPWTPFIDLELEYYRFSFSLRVFST